MQITALSVQYGHSPVDLCQDRISDLIGFCADNLDFCPCRAHEKHFVQHKRID